LEPDQKPFLIEAFMPARIAGKCLISALVKFAIGVIKMNGFVPLARLGLHNINMLSGLSLL